MILGFLVPLAMLGMFFTMLVATILHAFVLGDPFVAGPSGGGSYELSLVYLGLSLLFIVLGPGVFSLDRIVFGKK